MATLKIAICGDFRFGRLGDSLQRAFESLGHQVAPIPNSLRSETLSPLLNSRVVERFTRSSFSARRWLSRQWNQTLRETVADISPDFLLILNGPYVFPETIRRIRRDTAPVFIFHADNPYPRSRTHRPEYLPAAREATGYFIWSRTVASRLRNDGVSNVHYLPFAWDEQVFPSFLEARSTGEADADIVFIGNWGPERARILRPVARHFDLKIWGTDYWSTRTWPGDPLRDAWQGQSLTGAKAARQQAEANICLNILRPQNLPDGTNMRTFEVPGSGGLSLASRTNGATEIYAENVASYYFDGVDSLLGQLDRLLSKLSVTDEIRHRSHQLTRDVHTYKHRAQSIVEHSLSSS